nr:unnamed protein product [Callosobruchus analis]
MSFVDTNKACLTARRIFLCYWTSGFYNCIASNYLETYSVSNLI